MLRVLYTKGVEGAPDDHVILDELRRFATIEAADQGANLQDYHLVAVQRPTAAISEAGSLLQRALDAGVGVLLIDISAETKDALSKQLGGATEDDALGYYVARLAHNHYHVIELSARRNSVQVEYHAHKGGGDPARRRPPTLITDPAHPASVASYVDAVITHMAANHPALREPGAAAPRDPMPIPKEVKSWRFSVTEVSTWTDPHRNQTATAHRTYNVNLFLNNPPDGEPYQYVYITQEGTFHPGKLDKDDAFERGWVQIHVAQTLRPDETPEVPSPLIYSNSSPQNTAGSQTVTSDMNFSIGFNTAEGLAGVFDYSRSVSKEITDWRVVEDTADKVTRWRFAEATPLDAIDALDHGGINWLHAFTPVFATVKPQPTLAKFTLQTDTESLWRTGGVINDQLLIIASGYQSLCFFVAYGPAGGEVWHGLLSFLTGLKIELSKVV